MGNNCLKEDVSKESKFYYKTEKNQTTLKSSLKNSKN